jgi:hypothetical protein
MTDVSQIAGHSGLLPQLAAHVAAVFEIGHGGVELSRLRTEGGWCAH